MAPASRLTADSEPPGLTAGEPLTLDELLRRGVVVGGRRVARLTLDLVTGDVKFRLDDGAGDSGSPLSALARDILAALGQTPDEWVTGEEVCRRIGDGTGIDRSFYRAAAELRDAGKVESNQRRGYRLK